MKNWKTTLAGVLALVTAVGNAVLAMANGTPIDWTATMTAIFAAIGLFVAKDGNVTGGTVQQ